MEELTTGYCPCQEERFESYVKWQADYLKQVHTRDWHKERGDNGAFATPKIPRTRRGIEILYSNFPEADLVCPWCEQEYVKEVTIYEKE